MEQEEKLCDEVETVREFTYLGDRVSASRRCEAAVTARTRRGWVKLRECSEWQEFPLKLNGLFLELQRYLKESEMVIL